MAAIPYLVVGPTALLSLLGLLKKKQKVSPSKQVKLPSVDILIPTYNEQKNICACLASLKKQTIKANQIYLFDDNSDDHTLEYTKKFAEKIGLPLQIFARKHQEGKTASLHEVAKRSQADAIFVFDADTVFDSKNYIETCLHKLASDDSIASVCGQVFPLTNQANQSMLSSDKDLKEFCNKNTQSNLLSSLNFWQRFARMCTNVYRECLYSFLQNFVYRAQMRFCGSIVNPIGCAVLYRRAFLKDLFDKYTPSMGHNLTTSEDIFIGFAFCDKKFSNVQIPDVQCYTIEPPVNKLHRQILLWSSSFLQSCYYFGNLVKAPFRRLLRRKKIPKQKIENISWFIVAGLIEKLLFPIVVLFMILLQLWIPLLLTIILETLIMAYAIAMLSRKNAFRDALGCIMITPIRYSILIYELKVLLKFTYDIFFKKELNWRK